MAGLLEDRVRFVPADGGEPTEVTTTASMAINADMWADEAFGFDGHRHTREWVIVTTQRAIQLLAAQAAGLVRTSGLSLANIADMLNRYRVEYVGDDEEPAEGGGEDPTTAAQDA